MKNLAGKAVRIPDVDAPPIPALAPPGIVQDGRPVATFGEIDSSRGYPDVRSFRRKFGLLIPATNTSMEYDLWDILFQNQGPDGLRGVGIHTSNILTPRPKLETDADLVEYRNQILGGAWAAVDTALLAQPHYLIMGMSLEHVIGGIEPIRAAMGEIEQHSGLSWATWHDAIPAALVKFQAKRIELLTPFDRLSVLHKGTGSWPVVRRLSKQGTTASRSDPVLSAINTRTGTAMPGKGRECDAFP